MQLVGTNLRKRLSEADRQVCGVVVVPAEPAMPALLTIVLVTRRTVLRCSGLRRFQSFGVGTALGVLCTPVVHGVPADLGGPDAPPLAESER